MMANYDHIWGSARREWCRVDFKEKQVSSALLVVAWMSMLSFFVFAAFSILTSSDLAAILMIAALLAWVTSGIAVIRIKRTAKKLVTIEND